MLVAPVDPVHDEAFNVGHSARTTASVSIAESSRDGRLGHDVEYSCTASPDERSYRVDFGKLAARRA